MSDLDGAGHCSTPSQSLITKLFYCVSIVGPPSDPALAILTKEEELQRPAGRCAVIILITSVFLADIRDILPNSIACAIIDCVYFKL